jgi:hypothetical protein
MLRDVGLKKEKRFTKKKPALAVNYNSSTSALHHQLFATSATRTRDVIRSVQGEVEIEGDALAVTVGGIKLQSR